MQQMRVDPMPSASLIEAIVGNFLQPPVPGIYFRGSTKPLMNVAGIVNDRYYQHRVVAGRQTKDMITIRKLEEIDHRVPVLDLDGNIVASVHQIPFLSYEPVLPVVAIAIVEAAVNDVVESQGMEDYRCNPKSPIDLYGEFILPEANDTPDIIRLDTRPRYEKLDGTLRGAVIDQITEIVSGLRNDVKSFCGENPWVIHFLKRRNTELIIEKSIDWRIIEYHRLTNTKLDHYE